MRFTRSKPNRDYRAFRPAMPIALAALGIGLLIGCIPVPIPERILSGHDFRQAVHGMEHAGGLLNWASRSQVESVLGKPDFHANEGRTVGYLLHTRNGYYVWPLCFSAMPSDKWYLLTIRYDHANNALTWDVKTCSTNMIVYYDYEYLSITDEFFPRPATRPTSRPIASPVAR